MMRTNLRLSDTHMVKCISMQLFKQEVFAALRFLLFIYLIFILFKFILSFVYFIYLLFRYSLIYLLIYTFNFFCSDGSLICLLLL